MLHCTKISEVLVYFNVIPIDSPVLLIKVVYRFLGAFKISISKNKSFPLLRIITECILKAISKVLNDKVVFNKHSPKANLKLLKCL